MIDSYQAHGPHASGMCTVHSDMGPSMHHNSIGDNDPEYGLQSSTFCLASQSKQHGKPVQKWFTPVHDVRLVSKALPKGTGVLLCHGLPIIVGSMRTRL